MSSASRGGECPLNSPRLTSIAVDLADAARYLRGRHLRRAHARDHHRALRRRNSRKADRRDDARRSRGTCKSASRRRLVVGAGESARDEAGSLRPYRVDFLASRAGACEADGIFGNQGGHAGACAHLGAGTRRPWNYRERRGSGPIADTQMFEEIIPAASAKMAAAVKQVPVGRFGTPHDVARAVFDKQKPPARHRPACRSGRRGFGAPPQPFSDCPAG